MVKNHLHCLGQPLVLNKLLCLFLSFVIFLSVFEKFCMSFFPIENNDIEGLGAVEWTQLRFDYRRCLQKLFLRQESAYFRDATVESTNF